MVYKKKEHLIYSVALLKNVNFTPYDHMQSKICYKINIIYPNVAIHTYTNHGPAVFT
jgi:hypothetical protein